MTLTIRRSREHPDIETAQLVAIQRAARADARAQRRFHAMLEADDFHGRQARLYSQAERWLDALDGRQGLGEM